MMCWRAQMLKKIAAVMFARIALIFFIIIMVISSGQVFLVLFTWITPYPSSAGDTTDNIQVREDDGWGQPGGSLPSIDDPLPDAAQQLPDAVNGFLFQTSTESVIDREKQRRFVSRLQSQQRQNAGLSRACKRGSDVMSLVFVKVHKSASTTVANIVARYAVRHALNVALPNKTPGARRFNYFNDRIFRQDLIPVPSGQQYEVLFNHMIFNRQDLDGPIMPSASTFYFAIARHPEDRFVSGLQYYGVAELLMKEYRLASFKQAFLTMVKGYVPYSKPELYNSLAGDTGLPVTSHNDLAAVEAHARKLERDLDLVMIMEYFDESLVLLKRMTCLSMQDIIYQVKNERFNSSPPLRLNQRERTAFQNYQMADFILYEHFYRRFWDRVYAEGPDFFSEVRCLREVRRVVGDFCSGLKSIWDFRTIPRSDWNDEFMVTARDCHLMKLSEVNMQYYLMHRALKLNDLAKSNGSILSGEKEVERERGDRETWKDKAVTAKGRETNNWEGRRETAKRTTEISSNGGKQKTEGTGKGKEENFAERIGEPPRG